MKITAIITTRNEIEYIPTLVKYLTQEEIDCVFVDNESTDGTRQYLSHIGASYETLPYNGAFDLSAQLRCKANIINGLETDWIIHHDADEIMHDSKGWGGLRAAIERADANGSNCLNFDELVILPDTPTGNPFSPILHRNYYFFEPRPQRLMRAFRQTSNLSNFSTGGHVLKGDMGVKVDPQTMILRHYIVRSQKHAIQKYVGRTFSNEDLDRGWHGNRTVINDDNIKIPLSHPNLSKLPFPFDPDTVLQKPVKTHFWQW